MYVCCTAARSLIVTFNFTASICHQTTFSSSFDRFDTENESGSTGIGQLELPQDEEDLDDRRMRD